MQRISLQVHKGAMPTGCRPLCRSGRAVQRGSAVACAPRKQQQQPTAADAPQPTGGVHSTLLATAFMAGVLYLASPLDVEAAQRTRQPPVGREAERCSLSALDKFAETRAKFSQEVRMGARIRVTEADHHPPPPPPPRTSSPNRYTRNRSGFWWQHGRGCGGH